MVRYRKIILTFVLVIFAFSSQAKNPPPGTGTSDIPANILIMLDNSGSMSIALASSVLIYGPIDVATDASGNVYVLEYAYTRIKVFNSSGTYLRSFGSSGTRCNQWQNAKAFTIYNDIIYLADMYGQRVVALGLNGQCVATSRWTSYPEAIAVNNTHIFIGGFYNGQNLQKFSRIGLGYLGGQTISSSYMNMTYGMSFNKAGDRLAVADYYGNKLTEFSVNTNGWLTYRGSTTGGYSSADGRYYNPRDVGYDSSGNIYATDLNNHRLQKFNSSYAY